MSDEFIFQFAREGDEAAVRQLLTDTDLPHEDIGPHLRNFLVVWFGEQMAGCVGLEIHNGTVLLRSLAVAEPFRRNGLGTALTEEILKLAKHLEARDAFLLTMGAERFFEKRGFSRVPREEAPKAIRNSKEFTSLCPTTATLMHRNL